MHIVVLGAGPAGMAAAWRLSQLGCRVTLLEKDSAVGGMAKTIAVVREIKLSSPIRSSGFG